MRLTPEKPLAGILAPLFALRGKNDLGVGDVGALREFVDWAAEHGFGMVQLLPINETGNDHSPYNAISSVALDPVTIEIAAVEDLGGDLLLDRGGAGDLGGEGPVMPLAARLVEKDGFGSDLHGDSPSACGAAGGCCDG
jgi:hypothetical protein